MNCCFVMYWLLFSRVKVGTQLTWAFGEELNQYCFAYQTVFFQAESID